MAVKKFVKFDSEKGYLDNKDDINYYASNLMRKVAFGKMLGDFDENGLYVINAKIVEELIKMPKVIVEIIDGADLIRSKVKADTFFHFILVVEDNKAIFKLLEKIPYQSNRDFNAGRYSDINEYILDEVIIPDKDFNRNALYEKYNISTDDDGEVLSIFDMDELSIALYYNLIEKLKIDYLIQNSLILKEKQLESIEADYFEAILTVLSENNEFGTKVKSEVKKTLAESHTFVIVSKPFFQHAVNEILDNYIESYLQDLTQGQRESIIIKIREIKAKYYQRFKALLPIEISKMAGVRFNPNQVLQEGVIGGLAQEILTKGFTSSDVRKILINEDELQLSIAKIRDMVKENEEICKRDNAKAKDITKDREQTSKFYNELEKEQKVDLLKPETLIKASIVESEVKNEKTSKQEVRKEDKNKKAGTSVKGSAPRRQNTNTVTRSGGSNSGPRNKSTKKTASANSTTRANSSSGNNSTTEKAKPIISFGAFNSNATQSTEESGVLDDLVDIEVVADRVRKSTSKEQSVDDGFNLK